ncbi:hypothetical protein HDU82_007904 [Entophlyctis luteolus]|nr:hypothetical protein HDU82_007904 [Entophlyctis luteolus]
MAQMEKTAATSAALKTSMTLEARELAAALACNVLSFITAAGSVFGPGSFIAVGYIDPGNWATDLQGGAQFNYSLLFVVLLSGVIAIILQSLTIRLGIVTGLDLPQLCRREFHYIPNLFLWLLAETAIVMTDLAEVIGAAIALKLLFGLPIVYGVLAMGLDVLIVLIGWNHRSMRIFEAFIFLLIFGVGICFMILIAQLPINWGQAFFGYVPSATLVSDSSALLTCLGILGATVMPHNLYLHSSLVQLKRPDFRETELRNGNDGASMIHNSRIAGDSPSETERAVDRSASAETLFLVSSGGNEAENFASLVVAAEPQDLNRENFAHSEFTQSRATSIYEDELPLLRKCLKHLNLDSVINLVYATLINSFILISAAAAFYDPAVGSNTTVTGIADAYRLLNEKLGTSGGVVFAVALFFSGQCSTVTGTLAGQVIMEGFLGGNDTLVRSGRVQSSATATQKVENVALANMLHTTEPREQSAEPRDSLSIDIDANIRTTPPSTSFLRTMAGRVVIFCRKNVWARRLVTRGFAIIPALVVTQTQGDAGVDNLLVISQVCLGVLLPFAVWPLVYFTSSKRVMGVRVPTDGDGEPAIENFANSLHFSILLCIIAIAVTGLNIYLLALAV